MRLHITDNPHITASSFFVKRIQGSLRLRGVVDDLLSDDAVGLLHNSVEMLRCLDWARLVVDPLELLEGTALRLDTSGTFSKLLFHSVRA